MMDKRYKLTESDVFDIKERLLKGERQKDIAAYYDVHPTNISRIKNNVRWGNIDNDLGLVKYKNNWSFFSPDLAAKVVEFYQAGNDQKQVAKLMNKHIKTIPKKIRPKSICQGNVHFILKQQGIKIRKRACKYEHLKSKMKSLKKRGYSLKKIGLKLGVSATTVGRYLGKNKV